MARTTSRIANGLRLALDPSIPAITYYTRNTNWGDALNPVLVERLSGRRPVHYEEVPFIGSRPIYSVIGSILGAPPVDHVEVWGSGFIAEDAKLNARPARIHAVRGPLTRQRALDLGLSCPAVYGDPALLFPRFYRPRVRKEYALGLIPHYMDWDNPSLKHFAEDESVLLIDVLSGVEAFVDALCRCEAIASSSLHGVIAADAYGVPWTWMELSDKVLGGGFKFQDYFASTGRGRIEPTRLSASTSRDALVDACTDATPSIDLDALLESCPFREGTRGAADAGTVS